MSYKDTIIGLLEKSSSIARKYFGKVSYSIKPGDNNQVLTKADLEIGSFIVSELKRNFPDHNIIDEESGIIDNKSEYTWVVDPIDGTGNFAVGIPLYGIIIGLLHKDIPVAGGVALPSFDEIYYGEKGQGAFKNGQSINVSREEKLTRSLVAYGMDSHLDKPEFTKSEMVILDRLINSIQNLRMSNSVYDAMMVASGKYGGYVNQSMRIWDIVGTQIIIEEAGGIIADINGEVINYKDHIEKSKGHFTFFSASNILHSQLLGVIKAKV
jgi:myo-inositol-1(or 4)-monophosphatase